MGQKDTEQALLIVRIKNDKRLQAPITEDYFLVNVKDYLNAATILQEFEESDAFEDIIETSGQIENILAKAGIDFEHVIDGRRFFFDNAIVYEEDQEAE